MLTEQLEQYAYLYSYAAVVVEEIEPTTERRISCIRTEVDEAKREVLEASRICRQVRTSNLSTIFSNFSHILCSLFSGDYVGLVYYLMRVVYRDCVAYLKLVHFTFSIKVVSFTCTYT